jgi:hypothetical protein
MALEKSNLGIGCLYKCTNVRVGLVPAETSPAKKIRPLEKKLGRKPATPKPSEEV